MRAGTKEQFSDFLQLLNSLTAPFGIQFSGEQWGPEVHFLDITLYFDNNNDIQHRLYVKPTDSRRYLSTSSFHDPTVFRSVPLSQILRVLHRNSTEDTRREDVKQLKLDLQKSGYTSTQLEIATKSAMARFNDNSPTNSNRETSNNIILSTLYFENSHKLRELLHQITDDISCY